MPTKRIFIVDDHPMIREGIVQLFSREPDLEVVAQADDISSALKLYPLCNPDATLIDISLKEGNGIELLKQILAFNPTAKILIHSRHEDYLFAERALHAGALGYLNKSRSAEDLLVAIRRVLDGKIYVSDDISERIIQNLSRKGEKQRGSPLERLSDREIEIFELLGKGHSSREIGEILNISMKTVESHRENIKKKMNLKSANELWSAAIEWGLEQG